MIDSAIIEARGGNGGNGLVAFRREAMLPRGGPGGGDGGNGGSVVLVADPAVNTLIHFRWKRHFRATPGMPGGSNNKRGRDGDDVIVQVPLGTEVWGWENGEQMELLGDLSRSGQRLVIAGGGRGGQGNSSYVSSTNQEPLLAEAGEDGEIREVRLNLKLLADIGLIGMPNAGKSSLLRAISAARPRVAAYPFTTVQPVLGVVQKELDSFVVVDIPGLIEGAHTGVGLGDEFLKHVERTRALVHVVDGSEADIGSRIKSINDELAGFDQRLALKPQITAVNKLDLEEVRVLRAEIESEVRAAVGAGVALFFISAVSGEGVGELVNAMRELARQDQAPNVVDADGSLPVIRPAARSEDEKAVRLDEHTFRIVHPRAVRLAKGSNLESWDARVQYQAKLRQFSVDAALERAGVETGDTVLVADWEFEWD